MRDTSWTTRDGREMSVEEMTDGHLRNAIALFATRLANAEAMTEFVGHEDYDQRTVQSWKSRMDKLLAERKTRWCKEHDDCRCNMEMARLCVGWKLEKLKMRRVEMIGNLGKDCELKTINGDLSVCNFTMAAKSSRKDDEGQWFSCAIFGKRAESLAPYLKKGIKVFVRGEFKLREWSKRDKSGTDLDVTVDELELLTPKEKVAPF